MPSGAEEATARDGLPASTEPTLQRRVRAGTAQPSLVNELRSHLAIDIPLAVVVVVYCALVLPLVPRWTDNAQMLAAFTNDEPFITQQLDGMTFPPYGNPSNFLEPKNASEIPAYWFDHRYYNLIYYGGTYLDIGFAAYMPLKLLGAPAFPTAPVILRAISFLAGLLSLMLLYNFAKRYAGRFAAVFAVVAVLFEFNFIFTATTIHPDMLQFTLALLTLIVATRQARLGDYRSAVAMGGLVGVIQGTKSGAPYLLPMVGLAILIGAWAPRHSGVGTGRKLVDAIGRFAALGATALVAFVASTPYLLFDPYYIRTTKGAFAVLSGTSPLIPITFGTWYQLILRALGWPLVALLLGGVLWFLAQAAFRKRLDPPLVLALALGISNVLWFTGIGRFWVVLYYLVPGLAMLSIFAGRLVGRAATALASTGRPGTWVARPLLVLVLLALALGNHRPAAIAAVVAEGINADTTPQFRLGAWAKTNVAPHSSILFDDEAYFDPARFPVQSTNAGLIRYSDLLRKQPNYFVLTDYPPNSNWIMVKRRTQHMSKWSADPYSVRLYQDLIDHSTTPFEPGPTPVPDIDLVHVTGPANDSLDQPAWFRDFDRLNEILDPGYAGLQGAISGSHRLLLYRVDPAFYEQHVPGGTPTPTGTPISSTPEAGYVAANAFDGAGNVWLAKGQGAAVDGAFIGVDYGTNRVAARTLKIKWVAAHWVPRKIRIEDSNDGTHWRPVVTHREVVPADQHNSPGLKRWTETIALPSAGAHRMWRVVALDVKGTDYFGVDELELLR